MLPTVGGSEALVGATSRREGGELLIGTSRIDDG
jgi:hypothetical protein